MSYELRKQPSGQMALYNKDLGETMHPMTGPWAEATQLYVGGSGLEGMLLAKSKAKDVCVFDVGLGGAANALAAIEAYRGLERAGKKIKTLKLISFENDLEPARFALAQAQKLGYPRGHEEALEQLLEEKRWEDKGVVWELREGDFAQLIPHEEARADVIFFDPFSPRSNSEMWSLPVLESLYRCRRLGSPARLITYSSAYGTRAALLLAGFFVGEGPQREGNDKGEKGNARRPGGFRTTEASAYFSELKDPLGPIWRGRWKHDREPWPADSLTSQHRDLRTRLLEHPQWSHFSDKEEGEKFIPPKKAYKNKKRMPGGPKKG